MKAKELMTPTPRVCTSDDRIVDAARMMRDYDVGSLPVVENSGTNRLIGIITDRDITVGPVADELFTATVADVMTPNPHTVRTDDDVSAVERVMKEQQVRRIPVVDELGSIVGVIAQADLALADRGPSDRDVGRVVEEISRPREGSKA
jgi:CBS domain-containing protein